MHRLALVITLLALAAFDTLVPAQTNDATAPSRPLYPVVTPPATAPAASTHEATSTSTTADSSAASAPSMPDQSAPVPAPAPAIAPSAGPLPMQPSPMNPVALPNAAQNQAQQQDDIKDVRPPFFFLRSWFLIGLCLGTALSIALLTFIIWYFWPNRQLSPRSAYELTLEKLEKARALLQEEKAMAYTVLVSETIRAYLGQRFQAPSTRRTTEEFLRLMERDQETPLAAHSDLLRHFLQSCDLVKFARYQPTQAELEDVQQRAWSFVTATKPAPAAPKGIAV